MVRTRLPVSESVRFGINSRVRSPTAPSIPVTCPACSRNRVKVAVEKSRLSRGRGTHESHSSEWLTFRKTCTPQSRP
jgi:hypothetical protein